MKAGVYIVLIALVLWAGALWERAHAPAPIISETPSASDEDIVAMPEQQTEAESAEVQVEVKKETAPSKTSSQPVGAAELPTPAPDPDEIEYDEAYVAALELAVHNRVNDERKAQGLGMLAYDDVLAQVAAYHSTDMAEEGYFAHEDEDGCDSACRVTAAGYKWRSVGENLFMLKRSEHFSADGAAAIVVAGWMGSPGHRKNLFNENFTYEGVGVVIKGDSIYVTEVLTRPR